MWKQLLITKPTVSWLGTGSGQLLILKLQPLLTLCATHWLFSFVMKYIAHFSCGHGVKIMLINDFFQFGKHFIQCQIVSDATLVNIKGKKYWYARCWEIILKVNVPITHHHMHASDLVCGLVKTFTTLSSAIKHNMYYWSLFQNILPSVLNDMNTVRNSQVSLQKYVCMYLCITQ